MDERAVPRPRLHTPNLLTFIKTEVAELLPFATAEGRRKQMCSTFHPHASAELGRLCRIAVQHFYSNALLSLSLCPPLLSSRCVFDSIYTDGFYSVHVSFYGLPPEPSPVSSGRLFVKTCSIRALCRRSDCSACVSHP